VRLQFRPETLTPVGNQSGPSPPLERRGKQSALPQGRLGKGVGSKAPYISALHCAQHLGACPLSVLPTQGHLHDGAPPERWDTGWEMTQQAQIPLGTHLRVAVGLGHLPQVSLEILGVGRLRGGAEEHTPARRQRSGWAWVGAQSLPKDLLAAEGHRAALTSPSS
jgi:hypothetical protein